MSEQWRAFPGFEGAYEVSDQGDVRSLDREVTQGNGHVIRPKGQPLRVSRLRDGGRYVYLSRSGRRSPIKTSVDDAIRAAFGEVAPTPTAVVATLDEPIVARALTGPIVHVSVDGDDLTLVDEANGKPYIVLKPPIEAIGLDYWTQVRKLRGKSWARTRMVPVRDSAGRTQDTIAVDVQTFLMLLATVDENRVAEHVRAKLIAYQCEVAGAIEAYFTRGGAINPRATEEQLTSLARIATARIGMLRSAQGSVDDTWLRNKLQHEIARGLGEEPEVDPEACLITVGEYLDERGMSEADKRSKSGPFGVKLKDLHYRQFGYHRGTAPRFVSGTTRRVAVYTEQHRPLFDQIWAEMRAAS